jgi:hypothetical protein
MLGMTEAWGVVIAALIAGASGLIGLAVGRRQVTDEAQVEHAQWLRGQRQEAYAAFLSAWDAAYAGLTQVVADFTEQWEAMEAHGVDASDVDEGNLEHARDLAVQAMRPVRAVQEQVLLLGPEAVDHAVERMARALSTLELAFVDHLAPIVHPRPAVRWSGAVHEMEAARGEMFAIMRSEVRSAPELARSRWWTVLSLSRGRK